MLTLQQKEIPSEQLEKAFNITVECQTLRTDNMSENRFSEGDKRSRRGRGDSHMEQTGIVVGNFEFNP